MKRFLITSLSSLILLACFNVASHSSPSPAMQSSGDEIKVWVDTAYGFYHCPATKWYGKTKQGVYMKQKRAQERGYRPAYGLVCKETPRRRSKRPR